MNGDSPNQRRSVFLYGAGRVGTAVALILEQAGHLIVGVASRSPRSAESAARRLGAPVRDASELGAGDLVLVGGPAAALPEMATTVAAAVQRNAVVVHFAGSVGCAVLDAVRQEGAHPAALHPVQACPDVETALRRLPGCAWGTTVDPDLQAWAEELVAGSLLGHPVLVAEKDRPLWHAAAVTTSNGIAALMALGEDILRRLETPKPELVLGPLAEGTIRNALEGGGGARTLTGPVVRGEIEVVESHRRALAASDPELAKAYDVMIETILASAERSARIDERTAADLRAILERT